MDAPLTPRRRRAFGVLAALLLALALEALARLGLSIVDRRLVSLEAAAEARKAIAAGSPHEDAARVNLTGAISPHPYAGFVMDPELVPPGSWPVNDFGLHGAASPLRRRAPDTLLVGVTGGSVAAWLARRSPEVLRAAIEAAPVASGRRVEIVELALGGYKQPQQLMTLQYLLALGGELDVLINLDGFNEVALYPAEHQRSGAFYAYPRNWRDLMVATASPEELLRIGKLAVYRHARRRWANALAGGADRLALVHVVWRVGDAVLASRIRLAERAVAFERIAGRTYRQTGPATAEPVGVETLVALWSRCSRELDGLCRRRGIVYLHALQPNQYLEGSKPMGDAERARAIDPGSLYGDAAAAAYPALIAEGRRLVADGVRFLDLTAIYSDVEEPVYSDDCCHVDEAGEALLARALGDAVAAALAPPVPDPE